MENTNEIITYYMYKVEKLKDEIEDLNEKIEHLNKLNLDWMNRCSRVETENLQLKSELDNALAKITEKSLEECNTNQLKGVTDTRLVNRAKKACEYK